MSMERKTIAREDVHNREKQLAKRLLKLSRDTCVSEANKRAIHEYLQYRELQGDTCATRYLRVWQLRELSVHFGKDFKEVTKEDVQELVLKFKERYSPKTVCDWNVILRAFFAWLHQCKRGQYPLQVEGLVTSMSRRSTRSRYGVGDILSRTEVQRISDAAKTIRDRAMPLVLYESGARISELLSMRISNVVPDSENNCCWITIYGKTGERTIPLYWSKVALLRWLEVHPYRNEGNAPVWIGQRDDAQEQLSYASAKKSLQHNAQRAGIAKPINPHAFRHSRATECASNGWNESDLKLFFGWSDVSNMPATYIHRSSKSVLRKVMEENNIQFAEVKQTPKAVLCTSCGAANPHDAFVCQHCNTVIATLQFQLQDKAEEELKKWV